MGWGGVMAWAGIGVGGGWGCQWLAWRCGLGGSRLQPSEADDVQAPALTYLLSDDQTLLKHLDPTPSPTLPTHPPRLPTHPPHPTPPHPTPPSLIVSCSTYPTYPTYPTHPTYPTYPTFPTFPAYPTCPHPRPGGFLMSALQHPVLRGVRLMAGGGWCVVGDGLMVDPSW